MAAGWRWDQEALAPPRSGPSPCPPVPTSEDVDSELSRPRLFFPGGLLLVLKESLLPAEGWRDQGRRSGLKSELEPAARHRPPLAGWVRSLTLGRQAIGPSDRAVGGGQDGRQGGEGHRELHVENLQPLLLGRQAQDLLLEPLVLLLQRVQRLQHLHDCGERTERLRGRGAGRGRGQRAGGGARGPGRGGRGRSLAEGLGTGPRKEGVG